MNAILRGVFLIALATGAIAGENPNSGSHRFGSKVIASGDSIARLIDAAGQPDRRVPVTNDYGKTVAEDLYYQERSTTIVVHTNPETGQVNWIEERR